MLKGGLPLYPYPRSLGASVMGYCSSLQARAAAHTNLSQLPASLYGPAKEQNCHHQDAQGKAAVRNYTLSVLSFVSQCEGSSTRACQTDNNLTDRWKCELCRCFWVQENRLLIKLILLFKVPWHKRAHSLYIANCFISNLGNCFYAQILAGKLTASDDLPCW